MPFAMRTLLLSACLLLSGCFDGGGIETGNTTGLGGGPETGNTGSLSGRIVNVDGKPVAHADINLVEVKLKKTGPEALTFRVVATDDSGKYKFDSLPEGRFAI